MWLGRRRQAVIVRPSSSSCRRQACQAVVVFRLLRLGRRCQAGVSHQAVVTHQAVVAHHAVVTHQAVVAHHAVVSHHAVVIMPSSSGRCRQAIVAHDAICNGIAWFVG